MVVAEVNVSRSEMQPANLFQHNRTQFGTPQVSHDKPAARPQVPHDMGNEAMLDQVIAGPCTASNAKLTRLSKITRLTTCSWAQRGTLGIALRLLVWMLRPTPGVLGQIRAELRANVYKASLSATAPCPLQDLRVRVNGCIDLSCPARPRTIGSDSGYGNP